MHINNKSWAVIALCTAGAPLHADEAEVYLSDQSLQGRYATGADLIGLPAAGLAVEAFINEEDDLLGAVELEFAGRPAGTSPWTFSAGPKLYAANFDAIDFDDGFVAAAVGGTASYALPIQIPAQLTGQLFYAPKITSFGDADDVLDYIIRVEMEFLPQVMGFLGYRLLEADLDDGGERELDDNFHIGVSLIF